jgi:hypothetical protein
MPSPRCCLWVLLALLVAGCGTRTNYKTAPVSGKITIDNRPLANATVTFTPTTGQDTKNSPPTSTGKTDDQGNYTLKLDVNGKEGAVPGSHRVRVAVIDRGGDGHAGKGQLVPADYNTKSTLNFEVPEAGSSQANFTLSSHPSTTPPRRGGPR